MRITPDGTLLIAHMDRGLVIEYTTDGKVLRIIPAPGVWSAEPLANGNVLMTLSGKVHVKEIDRQGNVVWQFGDADAPGYAFSNVQTAQRLANGSTLITFWVNLWSTKPDPANPSVQAIEVTPDKQIVWALSSWTAPADLGPSTTIQILDEHAK
jgi:hypothetical protein